jgi:hypothetical protein
MELVKRYRAPARGAAHELKLAIERGPGPALTGSSAMPLLLFALAATQSFRYCNKFPVHPFFVKASPAAFPTKTI